MTTKEIISQLVKERDNLRNQGYAIQKRKDGVPPISTWHKQFFEGVGGMFRPHSDDEYISNLRKEIAKLKEYISKFG